MRALTLVVLGLAACVPKIEPGPSATAVAEAPVRLLTLQDPSSPNIYLQALVAAGSAYDPSGQEGLAALTAGSLIEGGAGDRSGLALKQALYPTGGEPEILVDREWVSVRLTCHRDHAALCVEVFADLLTRPRFEAADVERVRDEHLYVVTEGVLASEEELGDELLDVAMFEGHPYGHPIYGRAGALPVLDGAAARAFHEAHYVREAVLAGLAGAWDDDVRAALEARLDALPARPAPELLLPAPHRPEGRELIVADTVNDVTGFHLGHPMDVDRNHPDWAALYLGVQTFGVHRQTHGRLFQILREARGLNYGTYAYMEPFVQRGYSSLPEQGALRRQAFFSLWIRPTAVENGPFALKLAVDELERLVADGLTEDELEANQSYLVSHIALEARDPGRRLAYALDAAATGTPNVLDFVPEAVGALTLEQVNAALKAHLDPENLVIVAVSGEGQDLVDRLTSSAPTPIVYNDVDPGEEQATRDGEVAKKDLKLTDATVLPAEGIFR